MTISDFIEHLQNLKQEYGDLPVYGAYAGEHTKETLKDHIFVQTQEWVNFEVEPGARCPTCKYVDLTPPRLIIYDTD